jgi:hypothetical protein
MGLARRHRHHPQTILKIPAKSRAGDGAKHIPLQPTAREGRNSLGFTADHMVSPLARHCDKPDEPDRRDYP